MSIPVPAIFYPVTITAGVNDAVQLTATSSTMDTEYTYSGTVEANRYATIATFISALQDAFNLATRSGGATWLDDAGLPAIVSVTATGAVQVTITGISGATTATITVDASSALTACGVEMGFTTNGTAAESGGEIVVAGDVPMSHWWTPGVPVAFDSQDVKDYARAQSVAVGGQSYTTTHASRTKRTVRFSFVAPERTFTARETRDGGAWQTFLDSGEIGRFTYYPDQTDTATTLQYFLLLDSIEKFAPERHSAGFERYGWEIQMGAYVA